MEKILIQKQKVIDIYNENIRNSFLESWKPYHKEKAKLEKMVKKDIKEENLFEGNRMSVKYNLDLDLFEIKINKSLHYLFYLNKKSSCEIEISSVKLRKLC